MGDPQAFLVHLSGWNTCYRAGAFEAAHGVHLRWHIVRVGRHSIALERLKCSQDHPFRPRVVRWNPAIALERLKLDQFTGLLWEKGLSCLMSADH